MKRKLTTVVAMDVVGFSRLAEIDEVGALDRLKALRGEVVDPAIARHSGRLVKLMGDGSLAEFASVVGALQCAIEIQEAIAGRNAAAEEPARLELRIGLHLGDVIVEGDDIYGDGVNVAARLESLAPPGGVVLSKQVHDHIGGRLQARFEPLGAQKVKNISRPIEAYRVALDARDGAPEIIRFGRFELDRGLYELREEGEPVAIEPQVFDFLLFLARNHARTVTKDEAFAEIWGERVVSEAALSSLIKAARRAVGDDGEAQHSIRTIRGRGLRFVAEIAPSASGGAPAETIAAAPVSAPADAATKPMVAVLPFENRNSDPSEDYLADGFAEDIITALSKHRWLEVVARNSSFAFRGATDGVRKIGEQLGAGYIVTGSVRKAGARARVTIQLVDAATEIGLWSERFDRDIVDIFDLQDEITEIVAARIEAELGLSERRKAERRPRKNRGAWDLYQLGSAEFYKFTPASNLECQRLMRCALELDPEFASAHSRLAYAIVLSMIYFDADTDAALMDEALAAARRAIDLDDQDANCHFTLGRVHLARCEYAEAIDALEFAVTVNPCLAVTYCGLGDSLAYEGRLDEAIAQFETAIRLSPHDPFRWAFYSYRALAHLFRREFDQAVLWARRSVQIPNAQYWAAAHLVAALGHAGEFEQARIAREQLMRMKPEFSQAFARDRLFYLKREDQLALYLEGLEKAGVS